MQNPTASPSGLRQAVASGLRRSAHTGLFLTRIIVPLSAGVALLQWTGALAAIGRALAPVMGLFGLPGEAAVAIVSGYFAGVYGGVAATSAIVLTKAQITVLALMILTAHNLVLESAVQSRSGTSGVKVMLVRLVVAGILGVALSQTLRFADIGQTAAAAQIVRAGPPPELTAALSAWAIGMARLLVKIFVILAALMIGTELMRAYGVFERLARPLAPLMRVLGLSERVTFLWLTATFLGIAYGAGLIMQEAQEPGRFQHGDLPDLHVSTGVAHSLLEDTLLFVAIGAHPFWILAPRPFAAAAAVRIVRRWLPDRPPARPPETPVAADVLTEAL